MKHLVLANVCSNLHYTLKQGRQDKQNMAGLKELYSIRYCTQLSSDATLAQVEPVTFGKISIPVF